MLSETVRLTRGIMGISLLLITVTAIIQAHSNMVNAFTKNTECGKTVGCYSDCDSGGSGCTFEMTYVKNGENIDITLKKSIQAVANVRYWIAIGFSKDTKMGDDSVTECVDEGSQGVAVYNSYNNAGKTNSRLTSNVKAGLSNIQGSYVNNIMSCSFSRKIISPAPSEIYSLNQGYTLLLGNGVTQNGMKRMHSTIPLLSPQLVDVQLVSDLSGEAVERMIKAHGSLMIVAWILGASIAIVFARYYKPVWSDRQIIGEKVWFQFHRCIMIVVVIAEIVGFVLIFVHAQTWLTFEGASDFKKAHPYLGVIVTALSLINPIMALFRPHPGDKNRIIFNWAHWGVGTVAHILAVLTIVIGVTLNKSKTHDYTVYVVVAYAIYQFIFELILEVHTCVAERSKAKGQAYEMKELGRSSQQQKEENEHMFKKCMLGIHVIVIVGFSAAIIVMVNIGNEPIM